MAKNLSLALTILAGCILLIPLVFHIQSLYAKGLLNPVMLGVSLLLIPLSFILWQAGLIYGIYLGKACYRSRVFIGLNTGYALMLSTLLGMQAYLPSGFY